LFRLFRHLTRLTFVNHLVTVLASACRHAALCCSLCCYCRYPPCLRPAPALAADPAAVAKIHGGIVDCVGCNLAGADLANTCVKDHDLHGAGLYRGRCHLDVHVLRQLQPASASGIPNCPAPISPGAILDGADLTGAKDLDHFIPGHRPSSCEGPSPRDSSISPAATPPRTAAGTARSCLPVASLHIERRNRQPVASWGAPAILLCVRPR